MIRKIGVLCQDRNSLGFLFGLQRRLRCEAELVEPSIGPLSKSTTMTRTQARLAVAFFRKVRADLIIRFTDADRERWQDVRRHEEARFRDVASIFVCGVAVNNTEQWLALDPAYLTKKLDIQGDLPTADPEERTGIIKKAVVKARKPEEPLHAVVARIVALCGQCRYVASSLLFSRNCDAGWTERHITRAAYRVRKNSINPLSCRQGFTGFASLT